LASSICRSETAIGISEFSAKSAVPISLLPDFFAWAGQHGVLSKLGALLEPEQQNVFPSKF
jgi:hypothetical protein